MLDSLQVYFKNLQRMNIYTKNNASSKDNKILNKRWDTRTHQFYEQILNGNLYTRENTTSMSNGKDMGVEKQIIEGK